MSITTIAKTLAPRRGSTSSMTTTVKKDLVLAAGELFIEYPNSGVGTAGTYKIKFGDGTTKYESLPYAFDNDASSSVVVFTEDQSATPAIAIAKVVSGEALSTDIAALKRAISLENALFNEHDADNDIHVSTTDRSNWNDAYTHSTSQHAPVDAEKNVITTIKRNGTALTPDSNRAVDIIDENTTYSYGVNGNDKPDGQVKLVLTDSESTDAGSVLIKGGDNTSVITDSAGNVVINAVDTVYVHPESGIAAGTYNSVTVDTYGHATAGSSGIIYPIAITADSAVSAKSLIGATDGLEYGPIIQDAIINITYPILYAPSAIAKDASATDTYIFGLFDPSGTVTINKTGIVYAKGLLNGTLFTVNSIVIGEPTTNDGYEYLSLGVASGNNLMVLTPDHQIYKFINGIFARYSDGGDFGSEDPMTL